MQIFWFLSISISCLIGCLEANQPIFPTIPSYAMPAPDAAINPGSRAIKAYKRNAQDRFPMNTQSQQEAFNSLSGNVFDISSPVAIGAILACTLCLVTGCASGMLLLLSWYFLVKYVMRYRKIEKQFIKLKSAQNLQTIHEETLLCLEKNTLSNSVRPSSPTHYKFSGYDSVLSTTSNPQESVLYNTIPAEIRSAPLSCPYRADNINRNSGEFPAYAKVSKRSQLDPLPSPIVEQHRF